MEWWVGISCKGGWIRPSCAIMDADDVRVGIDDRMGRERMGDGNGDTGD